MLYEGVNVKTVTWIHCSLWDCSKDNFIATFGPVVRRSPDYILFVGHISAEPQWNHKMRSSWRRFKDFYLLACINDLIAPSWCGGWSAGGRWWILDSRMASSDLPLTSHWPVESVWRLSNGRPALTGQLSWPMVSCVSCLPPPMGVTRGNWPVHRGPPGWAGAGQDQEMIFLFTGN